LKIQFETVHAEYVGYTPEKFLRKLNDFSKHKQAFQEVTTLTSKPLPASLKIAYRVARCENLTRLRKF